MGISGEDLTATDEELFSRMKALFEWTSRGRLRTVALEMFNKFRKNEGGIYQSSLLNEEVNWNVEFRQWVQDFADVFARDIKMVRGNLTRLALQQNMPVFSFGNLIDKALGLGITLHQVYACKAELLNYEFNKTTGDYKGIFKITLLDDFGLDKPDVIKNKSRFFVPPKGGSGFKAWWILQHYRCYRPFITEIVIYKQFLSNINR